MRLWLFAAGLLGAILVGLGLLAAPLLIPVIFGEVWWSWVLMGAAIFAVISFFAALSEWL
jgi:hypothetical protein